MKSSPWEDKFEGFHLVLEFNFIYKNNKEVY